MKPFRDWKIRAKLISVTLLLVLLPLIIVSTISSHKFSENLRQAAEDDLTSLVRAVVGTCRALNEAVPEKARSLRVLSDEIGGIRVGKTGYVFIMDSTGTLKIHPARKGDNIIDSKDSEGFEYIRAMVNKAKTLKGDEVGTIRYPWINRELGEKKARYKIAKYMYFKDWDWIIVAGTYEEEIYHALYETTRFTYLMVMVSVVLVLLLTVALSRVLTRPILALTSATSRMAGGDLTERVRIDSKDEIGVLGRAFNRMISQIENHTTNLETMVEERTLELKESREKYRELSRFLHSILDSATEYAIMAVDFYGNIIEFNKGAEKLFGWKEEEVLHKKNISITILSEDQEMGFQREVSKRAQEGGVCEQDMERIRKNGDRFPAISVVTALRDTSGKVTGFLEIVRDLTHRKALERELRETKEFLENITESSVDPIVTTDLQGKITYLNRACEELFQYRKEELLGEHISKVYVRGIQEARDIMATLQREEKYQNYEMEAKARNGAVYTILNSIFMVHDMDGAVIGTAGIFKNITEQKRLEAELKQAQVRLVEASRMRALGELVAGVAHELNNPLMASQTILHVILHNLHEGCPNQERLELVRKCNDRIEKIVEHLREFSRQKEPVFHDLDINEPIENALLITGQQLLDHAIVIVKALGGDLPKILGDTNQLEQVFLNLIANARDAMDEVKGTKELRIRSYLSHEEGTDYVVASIKDNGVGIPADIRDKIFDPFFSTKPVGKGTGLGLSLCFSILEAHAGRMEIQSSAGSGTEVLVYIPLGREKEHTDGKKDSHSG